MVGVSACYENHRPIGFSAYHVTIAEPDSSWEGDDHCRRMSVRGMVSCFVRLQTSTARRLIAAIGITLYEVACLFDAFFHGHALGMQRRVERALGMECSTHLGRWVRGGDEVLSVNLCWVPAACDRSFVWVRAE